jgi:Family of unknown function (DUF5317)
MFRACAKYLQVTYLWVVLIPYAFMLCGMASNQAVLIANHTRFPVLVNEAHLKMAEENSQEINGTTFLDPVHIVMTKQTHLNALADIFYIDGATYSVGDFFLYFADWLLAFTPFVWMALVLMKLKTA